MDKENDERSEESDEDIVVTKKKTRIIRDDSSESELENFIQSQEKSESDKETGNSITESQKSKSSAYSPLNNTSFGSHDTPASTKSSVVNRNTSDSDSGCNSEPEIRKRKRVIRKSRSSNSGSSSESDSSRKKSAQNSKSNSQINSSNNLDLENTNKTLVSENSSSESEKEDVNTSKRIKNKKSALTDKFKNRFSKSKKTEQDEEKINASKSKISALCDSENSDDENDSDDAHQTHETPTVFHVAKKKNPPKERTEKPQRMSAKEAMVQMQKIKSESGRMLREKQVSLPYHRPKQLSLAEILNRKKISLTVGEKKPSFKMNEEQLKNFSREIEEKVKTMIELCKSESEEEEEDEIPKSDDVKINDQIVEDFSKSNDILNIQPETELTEILNTENNCEEINQIMDEPKETSESLGIVIENQEDSEKIENSANNDTDENNENIEIVENSDKIETVENSDKIEINEKNEATEISEKIDDNNVHEKSKENVEMMEIDDNIHNKYKGIEEIDKMTAEEYINSIFSNDQNKNKDTEDIEMMENSENSSETQLNDQIKTPIISQILQSSLSNLTPKLTGCPGTVIDLDSGDVKLTGVELLKQRFRMHSAMKTPEEKEREREKKIQPGALLSKLKRELEDQMNEQRSQEWAKKMEEERIRKEEEKELTGNLSDCEEALADETDEFNKKEVTKPDSESGESEPEENDVIIKDKPKSKCDYLDEEAEEDEDEEEKGSAVGDDNVDDEETNEESSSEEDSDSGDDLNDTVIEGGKKPSRILKAFEDSDDELDNITKTTENKINQESELTTPMKSNTEGSTELFTSQDLYKDDNYWEDLTLGQKNLLNATPKIKSGTESLQDKGSSFADLVSPLIKSSTDKKLQSCENLTTIDNQMSPSVIFVSPKNINSNSVANDKLQNLQKKLFCNYDISDSQNTEELVGLCSGAFPTNSESFRNSDEGFKVPEGLLDKINEKNCDETTQGMENELLELCSGKFAIPEATQQNNTSSDSQNITLSWSEQPDSEIMINSEEIPNSIEKPLVQKTPEKPKTKENNASKNSIQSFFKPVEKSIEQLIEKIQTETEVESTENIQIPSSKLGRKFVIISSSEDEIKAADDDGENLKKKVLKSKKDRNKKKKRQALQISDDEISEIEDDENEEYNSGEEAHNDSKIVDYDSEENEIEVQTQIIAKPKKKKTSDFFEQEAELTSEDEWKGSGDEDERGLDMLEAEDGDLDQLDQNAVRKELEKIHMRQILDQDKREVRILQEMLLEDGDLEGGTRERKFRWKNIDTSIENGAVLDDDSEIFNLEDAQSEEQWRRQRHEREVFLQQLMEKDQSSVLDDDGNSLPSVTKSAISSAIFVKSKSDIIEKKTNVIDSIDCEETENIKKKPNKDLPSPAKKPFFLIQNNVRGSFLSRGQAALNRLALLTKNGPANNSDNKSSKMNNLGPRQKGNFVFTTISPPCKDKLESEDIKLAKRKANAEINSTPLLIKKMRVTENTSVKRKSSLLDHIE